MSRYTRADQLTHEIEKAKGRRDRETRLMHKAENEGNKFQAFRHRYKMLRAINRIATLRGEKQLYYRHQRG